MSTTTAPRLILASSSPYRAALLEVLGVPFRGVSHNFDEDALKGGGLEPAALAARLADEKAESLSGDWPADLILASDQVAVIDGDILDKPGTEERAVDQLRRLSGRTHSLITAVTLRDPSGVFHRALDVHKLTMRELTEAEIVDYVRRDQPLDCCGSFKIESLGIALFSSIEGEDFTAIQGLPMMAVVGLLRSVGFYVLGPRARRR